VFSSIRARYKHALEHATQGERIILGVSYEGSYSRNSRSLHAKVGGVRHRVTRQDLRGNAAHVGILAAHVLSRAYELSGAEATEIAAVLTDVLGGDKTDAPTLLRQKYPKDYQAGDFVVVADDLAEVLESSESKYGYTSFHARYVSRPPIEEIDTDWFPADRILRIVRQDKVPLFIQRVAMLMPSVVSEEWESLPPEELRAQVEGALSRIEDLRELHDVIRRALQDPEVELAGEQGE
jgi:hypothetical protein